MQSRRECRSFNGTLTDREVRHALQEKPDHEHHQQLQCNAPARGVSFAQIAPHKTFPDWHCVPWRGWRGYFVHLPKGSWPLQQVHQMFLSEKLYATSSSNSSSSIWMALALFRESVLFSPYGCECLRGTQIVREQFLLHEHSRGWSSKSKSSGFLVLKKLTNKRPQFKKPAKGPTVGFP